VFLLADLIQDADHLEANPVQQNGIADSGASGKHVVIHLHPEDAHAAALRVVVVVDPASQGERDSAYMAVDGGHARDLAVGARVVAHGADIVAGDDGRDVERECRLRLDGEVIVIGEIEPLHGVETALDRRGAASEEEDDVLAETFQLLAVAVAEAFADAGEQ